MISKTVDFFSWNHFARERGIVVCIGLGLIVNELYFQVLLVF